MARGLQIDEQSEAKFKLLKTTQALEVALGLLKGDFHLHDMGIDASELIKQNKEYIYGKPSK